MPRCNTATYKRLQHVLRRQCNYTTLTAKAFTGICRGFSGNLPRFAAVVWRVYPAMLYSLQDAGGHTGKRNDSTDNKYQRHAGRCTGQHSRPIIIRYIRAQGCAAVTDPCQTVQHIADYASPAEDDSHAWIKPWHRISLALSWHMSGIMFFPGIGGAKPLTAAAVSLFGLSPDSQ